MCFCFSSCQEGLRLEKCTRPCTLYTVQYAGNSNVDQAVVLGSVAHVCDDKQSSGLPIVMIPNLFLLKELFLLVEVFCT
jgi:hypothetical protein